MTAAALAGVLFLTGCGGGGDGGDEGAGPGGRASDPAAVTAANKAARDACFDAVYSIAAGEREMDGMPSECASLPKAVFEEITAAAFDHAAEDAD